MKYWKVYLVYGMYRVFDANSPLILVLFVICANVSMIVSVAPNACITHSLRIASVYLFEIELPIFEYMRDKHTLTHTYEEPAIVPHAEYSGLISKLRTEVTVVECLYCAGL